MAKRLIPKPLHFNKALWSASDFWRDHRTGCELCVRVHVGRPHTIQLCCGKGAQLLKTALAAAAADGVQLTDKGREELARYERAARLVTQETEHG